MLDALITGRLHGKPTQKAAKTGKPFAIAKVRVATGDQAIFVSVVAFDAAVCNGLLALDEGDSVALAGTLTPTAWLDREGAPRPGMDMVAHALLTAYHVKRKRAAQAEAQQPRQQREPLDDFEARQGLGDW